MKTNQTVALVTGGASGLGEATTRLLVSKGAKVAFIDLNQDRGTLLEKELGRENALFIKADVTKEADVQSAIEKTIEKFKYLNCVANIAGIGIPEKVVGRKGPHDLGRFAKVIEVNLIGTFNVLRLAAAKMAENTPNEEGERGVIINTASAAAFEGQIGQAAYSASKGGVVSMTLPIARELAEHGIRVVAIAPGVFDTPIFTGTPQTVLDGLFRQIPFPSRFGKPQEYAMLVESIINNPMFNGTTIRLDGAARMPAK